MKQQTSHVVDERRQPVYHLLMDGEWVEGQGPRVAVHDKYKREPFASITVADQQQVNEAVSSAHAAFRSGVPVAFERGAVLDRAAVLLEARLDDFVRTMQFEAGFTASDATGEVRRCIQTLKLSAEEARRLAGDVIPLAGAPNQAGRIGFTMRVPLGVVAAITPFNSPLNTVAHKVAPAFAAGNAVILKPSTHTPLTACKLAEVLLEAGMPRGFLSVLHGSADVVKWLQQDERVRFFAFTGSTEVGRKIQQAAGLRRTQMELGSIACTILCDDAQLDAALQKVVNAGYRKAGQVCTSVQLLLVHASLQQEVERRLADMVKALPFGDPQDPATVVGPVISEEAAVRIDAWIQDAVAAGARLLAGGKRQGAVVPPTLLTGVSDAMNVACSEIFGPVVCILPFQTLEQAIERVNATPFGLAAGVFTNRLDEALSAAQRLEVGGVHINETSSSRVDLMPYGGSKDSGFGREGPHYAVHEMTEERIVTFTISQP
ncbi:MAG: aldehyde dehydrogenase family protein [Gammaproteobacteria bacterium]|nr:aldehyde dehydrogenase family protein [Gammaproteobacteria bacterium]MBU0787376.1 aldehyde dehydrogenase family protein [Gammaproteobacteria bacterium]MBU0816461.1 aldehyde dehydrogenase family protein [Gammaproteobacteria bacterium]MBU1787655.1 aldehyde dehydrogenase family protein [Gammaproteobacteria bacterium]